MQTQNPRSKFSIEAEVAELRQIKDIQDELQMIDRVYNKQRVVIEALPPYMGGFKRTEVLNRQLKKTAGLRQIAVAVEERVSIDKNL
jgi:hypothetical protein